MPNSLSTAMATPVADDALATFESERRRLFAIAYRMLGSVAEAEDVLQDAYLKWHRLEPEGRARVDNASAFLVRLVTRRCIDVLRSAHVRRVEYVGPWLPEPIVETSMDELAHDPSGIGALADDLSIAFLLVLERLSPVERAVFLLRESFGFEYRDIARIVGKTEANCRQIDRRARQRLAESGRAPRPVDPASHERLLARFLEATRSGDVEGLVALLAEDAVSYSDGGGKATAARRPIHGADRVARFMVGIARLAPPDTEFRFARVNGLPGVLTYVGGHLRNVISIHVEGGRIAGVYIVVNPDKLPNLPL